MKGVYLASYKAFHPNYNIDYNDIIEFEHTNLVCDMMDVDLSVYDYIIASPPCNFWSRANYRRYQSSYSLQTQHLLPDILFKLINLNKPFIVENVRNKSLFKKYGLYDYPNVFIYEIGRHTYWTNIPSPYLNNCLQVKESIQNINNANLEGGYNVHVVIDTWLNNFNKYLNIKFYTIFDFL